MKFMGCCTITGMGDRRHKTGVKALSNNSFVLGTGAEGRKCRIKQDYNRRSHSAKTVIRLWMLVTV
jgi:hypothetical protein